MNIGKYSPTIQELCRENENWFRGNCENENDIYDRDGYDMYGYNENGHDRNGHDQTYYFNQYMDEEFFPDDTYWDMYEEILEDF